MRDSLQQLSKGAGGPELAEMADGVLKGNVRIRDIARSSAYGGALTTAFQRFREWEANLDPPERQRLAEQARSMLEDDPEELERKKTRRS
ncbi:hypothetical protein ACWT_6407 [Actinoplanes sp. SE50]|nr:hypothetical protein ACPL_6538 [Actinoplanes sp. SE50/110]ATO85822.1 hypothetical protein ACWT_6407 [Actinoplanes sp. SE50]SLM03235.1 hypothetical protein ACSP50_6524 [Actinoplanes sp. SE50/110]